MSEPYNENTPGVVPEGPPLNQPSMNHTPPTALTSGDDGSNFYNTPLAAVTPVHPSQMGDNVLQLQATDAPPPSNPPTLIPGLTLVNDPKENQTYQNDSAAGDNRSIDTLQNSEMMDVTQPTATHDQPETKISTAEVSQPENLDAMELEQGNKLVAENTGSGKTMGDNNGITETPSTAQATELAETEQQQEEEHPEWEIDSSPYESSDESSSDSSDSDEDEDYPILSPEEQARILMSGEIGSDDEGEGKGKTGVALRTTNEVAETVLPIPEVTVTPEMEIVLLGNVEAAIENTVLIAANVTGEYQVLEAGSLLCLEDRRVAGVVSETLGRVENPLYTVAFPTATDVEERGLSRGTVVYYVVDHSTFVFTQPLKGLKGSDASNFHDEEVAEEEVEFSDDEQEAEYRKRLKQKRQERKGAKNDRGGSSRGAKAPHGPSRLGQSELNYDDNAADDGYTPLARPKNLHEMMRQEAPVESDGFPNRHSGSRGRGRGSDRGRGGRGRGGGARDHHHGNQSHHDRPSYRQNDRPEAQQPQNQPPQYPPYNQQYPSYPPMPQQQQPQQQQSYPQGSLPTSPFNFQMPYQQAYQQPNPYQQMPTAPHINPLFLAAFQQQQQQQQHQHHQQLQPQYQQQQQYQQPQQPAAGQPQAQNQAMNFDQVKAQLDLLRQLSNGNQWPPRS
ncbi:Gar1/Naf1 RNA binding region-domain-containing protein [Aspergillus californicus]